MGVVGGLYVYRTETAPKPIILHGSPGVRHTADGKAIRWRARATTVYIDSSVDRLGPEARDAVRKAFGTWVDSDAPLPALTFGTVDRAEARLKSDGKNTVVFAPITIEGHEKDLAITITYSDEKTGNVVEADIVINAAYSFAFLDRPVEASRDGAGRAHDGPNAASEARADPNERGDGGQDETGGDGSATAPRITTASNVRASENSSCVVRASEPSCSRDVYDVENVLSHEVGHFFGLGEEMSDTSATMYLCTNRCETHKRELTIVDRAAVAWLYAKEPAVQDDESVGCGGAQLVKKGMPHYLLSFTLVALALVAVRWSGRARRTGQPCSSPPPVTMGSAPSDQKKVGISEGKGSSTTGPPPNTAASISQRCGWSCQLQTSAANRSDSTGTRVSGRGLNATEEKTSLMPGTLSACSSKWQNRQAVPRSS
jgi:hypothetical protein